ncbi:hypothetical protein [Halorubrum laminariae]|uniref:Methanogenesis regulatory protein FilR1 middle domain-containing protein n=1 Tax=Halorubrum laminariae TaxID=1433523 RepID=A0ABD6C2Q3_9EURY|nr:hypothetical protein [Halorubrum laminariae]
MADSGPGAVLRSLVARAVDADRETNGEEHWSDDHRIVVTERGGDPEPVDVLSSVVGGTASATGRRQRSIVGVIPRIEVSTVRRLRDALDGTGPDRSVRLVFTGAAAERLSGMSGDVLRAALARHEIEATVHDGDSPIAVLLVGERAVVGLFDEDGLAALLTTDAPEVRSWAAGVCRRYVSAAADASGPPVDPERS